MEKRVEALSRFAAGVSGELREQPDEALDQFYKSILADPSNEPLALDVARRLIGKKDSERAIEILTRSAGQPDASGVVDALLGVAYLQANKPDLAIAASRRPSSSCPGRCWAIRISRPSTPDELSLRRPRRSRRGRRPSSPDINFLLELAEAY
jgi:hypothetical protein